MSTTNFALNKFELLANQVAGQRDQLTLRPLANFLGHYLAAQLAAVLAGAFTRFTSTSLATQAWTLALQRGLQSRPQPVA
jgi:hypothetical protein